MTMFTQILFPNMLQTIQDVLLYHKAHLPPTITHFLYKLYPNGIIWTIMLLMQDQWISLNLSSKTLFRHVILIVQHVYAHTYPRGLNVACSDHSM